MPKPKLQRIVALVGIILVALNLRTALTAPSPIYDQIGLSFPITTLARSIVGMLPPIAYAIFGWLTPRFVPKYGLEKLILIAMAIIFAGIIGRSLSTNIWMFASLSIVCLGGSGMTNVLLPPLIKQNFSNRIGLMTSIYTSLIYVSAGIPSLIAVPMTQAFGWRISIGAWAILALLAAIPWFFLVKDSRFISQNHEETKYHVWSWPIAWAILIIFGIGALNSFAMIAWLPEILTKSIGIKQAVAGSMMSLYSFVGFIPTLFVPIILFRTKHPIFVILFFSLSIVLANLGFMYLPEYALMWVLSAGIGLTFIPVGLTLINQRSRTKAGAAALSGFVQGGGYVLGAFGPLIIGWLRTSSGNWNAAFWFLVGSGILAMIMGFIAVKPKNIEDFT